MSDSQVSTTDTFTALEQAVIRYAVQDWAAQYRQTIGDPVRYISDGHLRELVDRHGTRAVWEAVAGYIRTHPRVRDLPVDGPEGRDARRAARAERADQLMTDAKAAFDAGDLDQALALIDEAELAEPTYEVRPAMTYDYIRRAMRRKAVEK